MSNQNTTDTSSSSNSTGTIKLGARFTAAEAELMDTLAKASGSSTSNYLREAVKARMLDDFLRSTGKHSNVRTPAEIALAEGKLHSILTTVVSNKNEEPTD